MTNVLSCSCCTPPPRPRRGAAGNTLVRLVQRFKPETDELPDPIAAGGRADGARPVQLEEL